MKKLITISVFVFCLSSFIYTFSNGQNCKISGIVLDSSTLKAVPFVNIREEGTTNGISASIDGSFALNISSFPATLKASLVGYSTTSVELKNCPKANLSILLIEKSSLLDVVNIKPKENPAWTIIKKVQVNKPKNNPDEYAAYRFKQYVKIFIGPDSLAVKAGEKNDSLLLSKNKPSNNIKNTYIYCLENYSTVSYQKPAKQKEIVHKTLANFPIALNKMLNTFTTDALPFSFYPDQLALVQLKKIYINPISSNTFNLYDLVLIDSVAKGNDTIFSIAFQPLKGKNFDGLKGILYVNSNGFAIEKVLAKPADPFQKLNFTFAQTYSNISKLWFPTHTTVTLQAPFGIGKMKNVGLEAEANVYYKDLEINPLFEKHFFGDITRQIADSAFTKNINDFASLRVDTLNTKELNTYGVFKNKMALPGGKEIDPYNVLDKTGNLSMFFMNGIVPLGPLEFRFTESIRISSLEKFRPGIFLQNNQKNLPRFNVATYLGYGLKDSTLKYNLYLRLNFSKNANSGVFSQFFKDYKVPFQNDILGPNHSLSGNLPLGYYFKESEPYNFQNMFKLGFFSRPLPYTRIQFSLSQQNTKILNSAYLSPKWSQKNTEGSLDIRFAYKEQLLRNGRFENIVNRYGSVLNFKASAGIPLLGGEYEYMKFYFQATQQLRMKRLGMGMLRFAVGHATGNLPFNEHFSLLNLNGLTRQNSLELGSYSNFIFDKYADLTYSQELGRNLIRTGSRYCQPFFILGGTAVLGSIKNANLKENLGFKDAPKGVFTANATINHILRIPIFAGYVGLGVRGSYIFGPYISNLGSTFKIRPIINFGL